MRVITGLERFLGEARFRHGLRRVGLVTNHSAVNSDLYSAAQLVHECPDLTLVTLFGPEHGLWGVEQDMAFVGDARDPATGVPVRSLYGPDEESLRPTAALFSGLDALLFDIQDVGARYYTYAATLALCMHTCAEAAIPCIVLDRPNPLGGVLIEGNLVEPALRSFVGTVCVPQRHGLSMGELARLHQSQQVPNVELRVVPCNGWARADWFDQTGLPWVTPSPNMPTLETATVYPGMCLVEATTLSEGRGTTRPFEICGAPFIEPFTLARELAAQHIAGAVWRPLFFKPTFHKHVGQVCGGVQLHVTDRAAFRPLAAGLAFLWQVRRLWPTHFAWRTQAYEFRSDAPAIDLLCGTVRVRELLDAGAAFDQVCAAAVAGGEHFVADRQPFLLYA